MVLRLLAAACSGAAAAAADPLAACNLPGFQSALKAHTGTLEARAVWLNRSLLKWPGAGRSGVFKLYYADQGGIVARPGELLTGAAGSLPLSVYVSNTGNAGTAQPDAAAAAAAGAAGTQNRYAYLADGPTLTVAARDLARMPALHRQQLVLVQEKTNGVIVAATRVQAAGALDDLYAAAAGATLGVEVDAASTSFKLWAPTAQKAALCLYDSDSGPAVAQESMRLDQATGIWSAGRKANLSGKYYRYALDVIADGAGLVRNLVTDPYSVSLGADSRRSFIADLSAPALKPAGWDATQAPTSVKAQTDMTVYELHVRDFSINDPSVPAPLRGKYGAFGVESSNGMRHLAALARAGMTDVHLLPIYDIASIPEQDCAAPAPSGAPDSEQQQALLKKTAHTDCFNWGYDPYHYNAPEGSYASDAADGARRIIELREMVMHLHRAGLRVGMDVVYNHTFASGQNEKSVLDRIVPGYYHRLNAAGAVEQSTCCDNTATENLMMAKLMIDSAELWAREYKIDSFRFDLMGHQPRAVMRHLQARVDRAAGRRINLIGEGWNFGEVANGERFIQASQLSLNDSGIGTFSDRARDALRGGSASDGGATMIKAQGYLNGLVYDPNALAGQRPPGDLLKAADMVRVGLAGTIRSFPMTTYQDVRTTLDKIDYNGQPAAYASEPGETVNYVENHDNQTLYDMNVFKLPLETTAAERARVQMLAAAINAFSQGVAYFHAGIDTLRSKSLDRNSFNSGDWFNRIDWRYRDNYFGTGLPPADDNGRDYALMKPLLANAALKPAPADIAFAVEAFRDLLRIRASSTLFRLRSAADIRQRLRFLNTGARQIPTVLAASIDGDGYAGAGFKTVSYFINVDKVAHTLAVPELQGRQLRLHPVHAGPKASDQRAASARFDSAGATVTIPARSAVVFVE